MNKQTLMDQVLSWARDDINKWGSLVAIVATNWGDTGLHDPRRTLWDWTRYHVSHLKGLKAGIPSEISWYSRLVVSTERGVPDALERDELIADLFQDTVFRVATKEKRPRSVWLSMQGYNERKLPLKALWHNGRGGTFLGMTDAYSLENYRRKGFVLDERFLDPKLWPTLEYKQDEATTEAPELRVRPSPLVREAIRALGGKSSWEGLSSELVRMVDTTRPGVPKTPAHLSEKLVEPETRAALASYGILVDRRRANGKRLISLKRLAV